MAPMAGASPVALAAAVTNAGAPFLRLDVGDFSKLRARFFKFLVPLDLDPNLDPRVDENSQTGDF